MMAPAEVEVALPQFWPVPELQLGLNNWPILGGFLLIDSSMAPQVRGLILELRETRLL